MVRERRRTRRERRRRRNCRPKGGKREAVAVSAPTDHPADKRPVDGSGGGSRPSMTNRHGPGESLSREDLAISQDDIPGGAGLRPISVEEGRALRDEAVHETTGGAQARPWYSVVSEFRDWYDGYLRANIEYEGPDGEIARTRLENSYQPQYGKRYYAKLKDLERAIERGYEGLKTVMLTLTASNKNAEGGPRCPADHMRDIMDGYDAARKQIHKVLSGRNWEYARVWEPHESGYGHLHIAVFVEDDPGGRDLGPADFEAVMQSHVSNCDPAGTGAHQNSPCEKHEGEGAAPWESAEATCDDCDVAVSMNDNVENLGTYISEYIGIFGEEVLDRPMSEQAFYATCWATGTRRVDFSNGAHDMMAREQFRRETGLRPEDRGGRSFAAWRRSGDPDNAEAMPDDESDESGAESGAEGSEGTGWGVRSICTVRGGQPSYSDPTTGGVDTTAIDGREGVDPPPERA